MLACPAITSVTSEAALGSRSGTPTSCSSSWLPRPLDDFMTVHHSKRSASWHLKPPNYSSCPLKLRFPENWRKKIGASSNVKYKLEQNALYILGLNDHPVFSQHAAVLRLLACALQSLYNNQPQKLATALQALVGDFRCGIVECFLEDRPDSILTESDFLHQNAGPLRIHQIRSTDTWSQLVDDDAPA
eukprot:CAMPEP_0174360712 /NCGR_PEP_ID=MMETSP0811_2-20130205/55674_1 /TAXON_ID=73025 ORGANISM="Eutreptiella gymnastica-like, Strain CCMP1594" /NCGR_SAMPLE_ID=MMETSP0811_2 /ASSEMBLY_ACC=CAM_ASM_000667 /LENGTH=187 /DNA_ID=CAMNT_0015496747 /DNA_START=440 /DNA_END=1004 /DNA_ORIENTATION=-